MNTMKRKFLALTMAFLTAAALCTGCGSQAADQEQTTQNQTTNTIKEETGYKESEVSYPEGQVFCMGKEASGKPVAFLFDEKHTTQDNAAYKKYVLENGKWEEADMSKTNELLKKNKINMLYSLTETADGKFFGIANKETGIYLYALTDKFKAYPDAFGEKEIKNFQVVDDIRVLVMDGEGNVSLNDFKGKSIRQFGESNAFMDVVNGMVFTVDTTGTKITVYDLETGQKEDEYEAQITQQGICFAVNDNDEIYAATEKGIYLLENGKMTEVVPEKTMSTSALSSEAWLNGLYVQGDKFYVSYVIEGDNSREYRMTSYEKK